MRKDPCVRLGSKGAGQIRNHSWFASLNWDDVIAKSLTPPFKPHIHGELDVGNFAEEFTAQEPIDSPAQPPQKHNELFRVSNTTYHLFLSLIHLTLSPSPSSYPLSYISPFSLPLPLSHTVHLTLSPFPLSLPSLIHLTLSLPLPSLIHLTLSLLSLSLYILLSRRSSFSFSLFLQGYSFIGPPILFSQNSITPSLNDTPLNSSPFLQQYSLADRQLGMGSFSICHVCVEKATGQEYAVKIVSRRHNPTREVAILQQCQGHPNIVHLHEVVQDQV